MKFVIPGAIALGLLSTSLVGAQEKPTLAADAAGYTKIIAPFFETHCNRCHTGAKPKGDFSVESKTLINNFLDPASKGKWKEVVNVLNSHEMPPKKEKQPTKQEVAAVVDWITEQSVRAELAKRETTVVMRRLNRQEYHYTIRDLFGIDYDTTWFPQDPPAGGFDNNGGALTFSPLQFETYMLAARQVLDRALVDGERPATIKYRFNPTVDAMDRVRVKIDDKKNQHVIVNGGNNKAVGDWVKVHHDSWDMKVGARNFFVPVTGTYTIRAQVAGRVPDRAEVLKSAEALLAKRKEKQDKENPKSVKWHDDAYNHDLEHFKTDRMYTYGAPRVKVNLQLGSQPKTLTELDLPGTLQKPGLIEFNARFTTEVADLNFEYAYSIPRTVENFWMQGNNEFARPEMYIDWFEVEGPIYDAWPPSSHRKVLFDSPKAKTNPRDYAQDVLAQFMAKAYRRPVSNEEIADKLKLYDAATKKGDKFLDAIKQPLAAVMVSAHFLYLSEPLSTDSKGPRALNDYELASRLSYFLWSSTPDDELTKLAKEGKLRDLKVRSAQVSRLLKDPKSDAFVKNFAGQWLGLRDVGANPPAKDLYPHYDRHLETSIIAESEEFFKLIMREQLDIKNFIKSDFVTINERLARFYDIPGVRGDEFRKVTVPQGVTRGGIVTQASILTTTSNGTRTSPVKRGTWILKTLMGIDPGLPVANAGEIAPKVPGIDKATVRKRLEIHRSLEQCARCHNKIDPLGFALENFNASGEWREQEGFGFQGRIEKNDPKIDASSEMIDGTKIVGVRGLQDAMLKQEDLFFNSLASKLLTYALGRELGLADQPTVKAMVDATKKNGRTIEAMVQFIANSELFTTK